MNAIFVIADAGVNHHGDINVAYSLIDAAKKSGADAIKFQTFKTEKIVTRTPTKIGDPKKKLITAPAESQFDMTKKLELSYKDFQALQQYCKQIDLCFLSTPDEVDSLDFLVDVLHIPLIRIGSGDVNNLPYLKQIAAKNKPMILSTGMSTLGEVEMAIAAIRSKTTAPITLLHCTTSYPCPLEQVNLSAMLTLKDAFKLPIGYSDRTLGIEVPIAAAALGATVIEKHFTLNKNIYGPDRRASLDPAELTQMVTAIRHIETAMGDGIKRPNVEEEKTKQIVRKRLVVNHNLPKGHVLTPMDLEFKRANSGLFVDYMDLVVGKKLISPISVDTALQWKNLMV